MRTGPLIPWHCTHYSQSDFRNCHTEPDLSRLLSTGGHTQPSNSNYQSTPLVCSQVRLSIPLFNQRLRCRTLEPADDWKLHMQHAATDQNHQHPPHTVITHDPESTKGFVMVQVSVRCDLHLALHSWHRRRSTTSSHLDRTLVRYA